MRSPLCNANIRVSGTVQMQPRRWNAMKHKDMAFVLIDCYNWQVTRCTRWLLEDLAVKRYCEYGVCTESCNNSCARKDSSEDRICVRWTCLSAMHCSATYSHNFHLERRQNSLSTVFFVRMRTMSICMIIRLGTWTNVCLLGLYYLALKPWQLHASWGMPHWLTIYHSYLNYHCNHISLYRQYLSVQMTFTSLSYTPLLLSQHILIGSANSDFLCKCVDWRQPPYATSKADIAVESL